jgi:hypothetical protein
MSRHPLLARIAGRVLRRRLRRLAGTQGLAWAVRLPLVTLVVVLALALHHRHAG